ncbi:hypothetical protein B0H10DRAFT_1735354, partial [Mycena sp. CBHHK59/15]
LVSNDPPPESQISPIREVIRNGPAQVNLLNCQISAVQATVARLVDQCDRVKQRIRQHTSILSPIRRLPPEILCEIFALMLPFNTAHVSGQLVGKSPWYLGHISRPWRAVATAHEPLWSFIRAHFDR